MRFSEATAVRRVDDGLFDADLDAGWTIGPKLHGGYLLALITRAVTTACDPQTPDPVAVSAQFLHAPGPGPAQVRVEPIKLGRTAAVWRAVLAQSGRDALDVTVTTGRLVDDDEPLWSDPTTIPAEPGTDVIDPSTLLGGTVFTAMRQVDVRLETAGATFLRKETGPPKMRMWTRPLGEEPDLLFTLVACDISVPTPFNVGHVGWAPTVQLTALLRARPAPGWLGADIGTSSMRGGWFDEDAVITDSRGVIVCQTRQLALLPK